MTDTRLVGCGTALATPFTAGGSIDERALRGVRGCAERGKVVDVVAAAAAAALHEVIVGEFFDGHGRPQATAVYVPVQEMLAPALTFWVETAAKPSRFGARTPGVPTKFGLALSVVSVMDEGVRGKRARKVAAPASVMA